MVESLIRDDHSEQDANLESPKKLDLDQQPRSEQLARKMENIDRNQVIRKTIESDVDFGLLDFPGLQGERRQRVQ